MSASFFFYDLETSGIDSKRDRIMQFAGIRTDMDLNPIGEPLNLMVALTDEVLPSPGAIMVTGITPQRTREEGYSEAEFLKIVCDEVLAPDTIIIGYNNVKFDDEFMRCTFFRNFYDPYEWQIAEGRSRWDFLDVVRLTRALRPDGIKWAFDENGVPSNRLEHLSAVNGLEHEHAHDALSDVYALIAVAKLIKEKQPKLYDYLLKRRSKAAVQELVQSPLNLYIHTSYVYPKEFMHTSVVATIGEGKYPGAHYVYDLRYDPSPWLAMSPEELRKHCQLPAEDRAEDHQFIPVRELKCNQCPAVAPLSVLQSDQKAQERIDIDLSVARRHLNVLQQHPDFGKRVAEALDRNFEKDHDHECQLYDGFIPNGDKSKMAAVRVADAKSLKGFDPGFSDERLHHMLVRYKARNFPTSLDDSERTEWESYRTERLKRALPKFAEELQKAAKEHTDGDSQYILEELQLYAQSILPIADEV